MDRQQEIKDLKKEYFKLVEKFTPEEIKNSPIFDLDNAGEIKLALTKDLIEKLKTEDWLTNYEKEAKVSTGGIRGAQNVVYYWDSRFPINQLGIALATLGKALVLKEEVKGEINKIVAGEVRYNTQDYIDLISRIQANLEINIHMPFNRQTIPVWMVSFLIFMLDYDGGEFVTSSHAISSKTATKDLENQGSQFLPEMSLKFIARIKDVIKQAKENPEGYEIILSPRNNGFIKEDFNGYDMYVDYLRKNVAKPANLKIIKKAGENGFRIMYDTVGGCMYKTMSRILNSLEVAKSANFEEDLKDKPQVYIVLITDPDGDRLVIGQVESVNKAKTLEDLGMDFIKIDDEKIFVVYSPTYSFFLIMDYYMKQLKNEGIWKNHPRFIIATTPSSKCWNEWAKNNGIKIVTTPVGMKEIAVVIKKVEKQILDNPEKEVIIEDVFGQEINLGKQPRMVFGGEESGGMITGLEEFIETKKLKRKAIAMREKSAGEASVIATALGAWLFNNKKLISEQIQDIFKENNIKSVYYFRDDIIYYNESEPDPIKLRRDKEEGEIKRDKTDTFYLSLTLALRNKEISIDNVREILQEVIPDVDFTKLVDLKFTGDATLFQFADNLFVQVRRSGTDAKMRGYAGGPDKKDCANFLKYLLHYSGERTNLYKKIVPEKYQSDIYILSQEIYQKYLYNGL